VATSSTGPVTNLQAPMKIHIGASQGNFVPAYSQDGTSWKTIPRLSSPELPAGQSDGYFVNADGSVDIYTRHLTFFGLLKDTQAPSKVNLVGHHTGKYIYLLLKGSRDNVRVHHYVVLRNGRAVKTTAHGYNRLAARKGRYQVVAVDAAGNRSALSATFVVR
jgi:hypothetical protein